MSEREAAGPPVRRSGSTRSGRPARGRPSGGRSRRPRCRTARPRPASRSTDTRVERGELASSTACIVDSNWLSWARSASSFASTPSDTSSTWLGWSASHSRSRSGRWWASPCSGKKCGSRAATIPSQASSPAWRWSGCSRYRFHGSCPSTTLGSQLSDHLATSLRASRSLASSPSTSPRKRTSPATVTGESSRRFVCSARRRRTRAHRVGGDVPRSLRPVGADQVVDDAAVRGPLGEQTAAAELDVVGMGADREGGRRNGNRGERAPSVGSLLRWLTRVVRSHSGSTSRTSGWVEIGGGVDVERQIGIGPHLDTAFEPARAQGVGQVSLERAAP